MVQSATLPPVDTRQNLSSRDRLPVMDGLRGVAAFSVVVFHSQIKVIWVRNGWLAVDLFFLLSGFVIAYSYHDKLTNGMPVIDFAKRRFVRLYPMLAAGSVAGFLLTFNPFHAATVHPSLGMMAPAALASLMLLPWFGSHFGENVFPFNPPIWSLFFEVFANIVHALTARFLSVVVLFLVVCASLIMVSLGGSLGGNFQSTFLLGIPRVCAGYFGGVLLWRLRTAGVVPNFPIGFYTLSAVLVAVLCFPLETQGWHFLPVFLVLAAVVAASTNAAAQAMPRIGATLGRISYPLYLVHWPAIHVARYLAGKAHLNPEQPVLLALTVLACTGGAYVVDRLYDEPARVWLDRLIVRKPAGLR